MAFLFGINFVKFLLFKKIRIHKLFVTLQKNKKMRAKFILFVVFIVPLLQFYSQTKSNSKDDPKDENCLLWKIEGKKLLKPSYIFGTVKYLCKDDVGIRAEVMNAFNQSQQLCLEVGVLDTLAITQSHNYMFRDSIAFSEKLSPAQYQNLDNIFYAKVGEHIKEYDNLKPFFIYEIYFNRVFDCNAYSFRDIFLTLGEQSKKKIVGVETPSEQNVFFGGIIQYDELSSILLQTTSAKMNSASTALYSFYQNENLYGIKRLMQSLITNYNDEYNELKQKRSAFWVKRIPEIMKNKTTFFIIGAEYLPGNEGLLQALRDDGYRVTPVKPKKDEDKPKTQTANRKS